MQASDWFDNNFDTHGIENVVKTITFMYHMVKKDWQIEGEWVAEASEGKKSGKEKGVEE